MFRNFSLTEIEYGKSKTLSSALGPETGGQIFSLTYMYSFQNVIQTLPFRVCKHSKVRLFSTFYIF